MLGNRLDSQGIEYPVIILRRGAFHHGIGSPVISHTENDVCAFLCLPDHFRHGINVVLEIGIDGDRKITV